MKNNLLAYALILLMWGCAEPVPISEAPIETWRKQMPYRMEMVIKPDAWESQLQKRAVAPTWQMADSVSTQWFYSITEAQEYAKANPDYNSTIIKQ